MKDNLNIEELFKEKFNSFEGDVSPDAWANIQQGMSVAGVSGSAGATGMSLLMKTVIITGGIVAATVATVVLLPDTNEPKVETEGNLVVNEVLDQDNVNTNTDDVATNVNNEVYDGSPELKTDDQTDAINLVSEEIENGSEGLFESNGSIGLPEVDESENEVIYSDQVQEPDSPGDDTNSNESGDLSDADNEISAPDYGVLNSVSSRLEVIEGDEFAPTTYQFKSNAVNASKVEWLFEDGTVVLGENVKYTFDKPGTYKVTMTVHGLGINGRGELNVEYVEIEIKSKSRIDTLPNTITPNNDHINDFFAISTTDIETFYIVITDAQGAKLFESEDPNFRWYGTNMGGEKVPNGVYYYNFFAKGIDGVKHAKAEQITLQ